MNTNMGKCSGEMPAHLICFGSDATAGALKIPLWSRPFCSADAALQWLIFASSPSPWFSCPLPWIFQSLPTAIPFSTLSGACVCLCAGRMWWPVKLLSNIRDAQLRFFSHGEWKLARINEFLENRDYYQQFTNILALIINDFFPFSRKRKSVCTNNLF